MASAPTHEALARRRPQLTRQALSAQTAAALREHILDGELAPGSKLSEPDICEALGVSRNTLREAFRILIEERLVTHEINRGAFVRLPTADDVNELYACRLIVECAAVRFLPAGDARLGAVLEAVARAEAAAERGDWVAVGGADIDFHRAITALSGSTRIEAMMTSIWNELRLAFHVVGAPRAFHDAYLPRNRAIADLLVAGRTEQAEAALESYLRDARAQVLGAYAPATEPPAGARR